MFGNLAEMAKLMGKAKDIQANLKKFKEEPELEVMNGRFGPYISYKGNNYKIPKDIEPQDLSLKSCMDIISLQEAKASISKKGRYARKKGKAWKSSLSSRRSPCTT